jgi:hypothetical protein
MRHRMLTHRPVYEYLEEKGEDARKFGSCYMWSFRWKRRNFSSKAGGRVEMREGGRFEVRFYRAEVSHHTSGKSRCHNSQPRRQEAKTIVCKVSIDSYVFSLTSIPQRV